MTLEEFATKVAAELSIQRLIQTKDIASVVAVIKREMEQSRYTMNYWHFQQKEYEPFDDDV